MQRMIEANIHNIETGFAVINSKDRTLSMGLILHLALYISQEAFESDSLNTSQSAKIIRYVLITYRLLHYVSL